MEIRDHVRRESRAAENDQTRDRPSGNVLNGGGHFFFGATAAALVLAFNPECLSGFATCQDDIDVPYCAPQTSADADLNANVEPKVAPKGSHPAFQLVAAGDRRSFTSQVSFFGCDVADDVFRDVPAVSCL